MVGDYPGKEGKEKSGNKSGFGGGFDGGHVGLSCWSCPSCFAYVLANMLFQS